jgi:hypothetical protein
MQVVSLDQFEKNYEKKLISSLILKHIDGVMVRMLASSAVDW